MLSNKMINNISLTCYAVVLDSFVTFSNPKMRGPAFTWENIEDHVAFMCGIQYLLNGTKTELREKKAKEAREFAERLGRQLWQRCLRDSGYGKEG